jgi:hypothetical protein
MPTSGRPIAGRGRGLELVRVANGFPSVPFCSTSTGHLDRQQRRACRGMGARPARHGIDADAERARAWVGMGNDKLLSLVAQIAADSELGAGARAQRAAARQGWTR